MTNLTETDYKYLAGLLDADGCLSVNQGKYYQLTLAASTSIDRDGKYLRWLHENLGGNLYQVKQDHNWSVQNHWKVYDKNTLNKILPRVLKHMCVKARYWDNLYFGDQTLTREDHGPLKAKKFPTRAWLSGFLDGDGHYMFAKNKYEGCKKIRVQVTLHKDDKDTLYWISDKLGGSVREDKRGYFVWDRNLGVRDRSFAVPFVKEMHRHSRLKKHKLEQILNYHSQRLSDKASTDEAIVH